MTDLEDNLQDVLQTLRKQAKGKRESARKSTSAQSKKYNQGSAYAYTIAANMIEKELQNNDG